MNPVPERIQRRRTAGWRMPEGAVFVGRPTLWGNPWIPGSPGRVRLGEANFPLNIEGTLEHDLTAAQAVELYRQLVMTISHQEAWSLPARLNDRGLYFARMWLRTRRATIHASLRALRGRPLVCWCPPDCPCHADVLLDLANR